MRRLATRALAAAAGVSLVLATGGPAAAQAADPSYEVIGEIKHVALDYAPRGWATCDGQALNIAYNTALFEIIGTTFGPADGGAASLFNLPTLPDAPGPKPVISLEGAWIYDEWSPPGATTAGMIRLLPLSPWHRTAWLPCDGREVVRAEAPALADRLGVAPTASTFRLPALPPGPGGLYRWFISSTGDAPLQGYKGDVRRWPAAAPIPAGWAACDGTVLPLAPNADLFLLLRPQPGGNGRTTFALPNYPPEGDTRWIVCTAGYWPNRE